MLRPRTILLVLLVTVSAVLAGACGGDSGDTASKSRSTSSSSAKQDEAGTDPKPGAVYEGRTTDGSKVKITIGDDGSARLQLGYVLTCDGTDKPQDADLGPFGIDDGTLDAPDPTGDGALDIAARFQNDDAAGTIASESYDDPKLGSCEEVDVTWKASVTEVGVEATGADGTFEPGEELLASDFEQDAEGWATANTATSFSGVEEGGLRVNVRTKGVVGVPASAEQVAKLDDVVVTTTATFRSSSAPTDSVGVSCRRDAEWGYNFYVGRDGRVGIFTTNGIDPDRLLASDTLGRKLAIGTPFELTAACVGGTLQLSVDGRLEVSASEENPWPDGQVALLVAGGANTDVLFDDARIAKPKG